MATPKDDNKAEGGLNFDFSTIQLFQKDTKSLLNALSMANADYDLGPAGDMIKFALIESIGKLPADVKQKVTLFSSLGGGAIDPMMLMLMGGKGDIDPMMLMMMSQGKDGASGDMSKLLPLLMMSGKGGDMSKMLPLLMMSGKGGDLGSMLPLLMAQGGGDMSKMLPLLMMSGKGGGDMASMLPLLMSQGGGKIDPMMLMMMGQGGGGNMASLLMMQQFMGKGSGTGTKPAATGL